MKTSIAKTQFDQPNLTAAPATPSCCCCCCCCLATTVSTAVIAGTSANAEAKLNGQPSIIPTLLGTLALIVAYGAGIAALVVGADPVIAFAAVLITGFGGWSIAFSSAGQSLESALSRSGKYVLVVGAAFALEFVVGFVLVLLYIIPYLLVGTLVTVFVVGSHIRKISNSSFDRGQPAVSVLASPMNLAFGPPTTEAPPPAGQVPLAPPTRRVEPWKPTGDPVFTKSGYRLPAPPEEAGEFKKRTAPPPPSAPRQ